MEWWLGRLCDEFHCLPSEALRETWRAPVGLLETILEMRAFAAAKQVVDQARSAKDIPDTPMTRVVQDISFAVAAAEMEERSG